jgi:hypothetical protein
MNSNEPASDLSARVQITDIDYRGDECWNLKNIRKGHHVLSVVTDPQHPGHTSSISHIITLE